MHIIVGGEVLFPGFENSDDVAAAGMADALARFAGRALPADCVAGLRPEPVFELRCRHVHRSAKVLPDLLPIELSHPSAMPSARLGSIWSKGGFETFPLLGRPLHRPDEELADMRPALPRFGLDLGDDAFHVAREKVVAEVHVHHYGDLIGRRMNR